ncbi:MAG: VanZ family protein [Pseudoalteromonas sp.]|uniref:VanZ family protein n=1 Tax=unclassified Pseudoalteromonas TaxID=194690 RepID=UPI000C6A9733|nr:MULTISPECIES: VanZ family protein [unclassified Pseudoalteromonas]MAH28414.1 trypsin [Pseudoalteromonadaceae bacterium]MCH2089693.1 VanZ family protein [Pseudoalteromonas sp.]TMP19407.1 trypsin [Pseudoalteromonas sp. S2721]|tara:strand:- start:692 stop:1087 length:396 start_codon:yes stop_codon:yes gene_type:complete
MLQRILVLIAIGFFAFIGWVIYLANTGQKSVFFELVAAIPYGDKLGHFCLFGLLTLFINLAFKFKTLNVAGRPIYLAVLIVSTFVILEELSQFFIESRTLDFVDLIADFTGIAIFSAISAWLSKKLYPPKV